MRSGSRQTSGAAVGTFRKSGDFRYHGLNLGRDAALDPMVNDPQAAGAWQSVYDNLRAVPWFSCLGKRILNASGLWQKEIKYQPISDESKVYLALGVHCHVSAQNRR